MKLQMLSSYSMFIPKTAVWRWWFTPMNIPNELPYFTSLVCRIKTYNSKWIVNNQCLSICLEDICHIIFIVQLHSISERFVNGFLLLQIMNKNNCFSKLNVHFNALHLCYYNDLVEKTQVYFEPPLCTRKLEQALFQKPLSNW